MKKRISSFCLIILLAVACIGFQLNTNGTVIVNAAQSVTADGQVVYEKETFSNSNGAQAAYLLSFNPKTSDYIPYVFNANASTASLVKTSANRAEERYGVEIAGGVNADFFGMFENYANIYDAVYIHDGLLAAASTYEQATRLLIFNSDGSAEVINSKLDYTLTINGEVWKHNGENALAEINKRSTPPYWGQRLYYWDRSCGTITDSVNPGTEIICDKLDNTELTVGGTLRAKVAEVKTNSSGNTFGINQFVLYAMDGSTLATRAAALKAGDNIEINVDESIAASKEKIYRANGAVGIHYMLVENGLNVVTAQSVGDLGITTRAQRTGVGIKADGTMILACTAGRKVTDNADGLTIPEFADYMIAKGCVTAVNLDGGGSTQMVADIGGNNQYMISSSRGVANGLFIVKRNAAQNLKDALDTALSSATQYSTQTAFSAAVADGNNVKNSSKSVSGDYTRVLTALNNALFYKNNLINLITLAANANETDYTRTVFDAMATARVSAVTVNSSPASSLNDIISAYNSLKQVYEKTGALSTLISSGHSYIVSGGTGSGNYADTANSELTDGVILNSGQAYAAGWVGFNTRAGTTGDNYPYYDINFDFNSVQKNLKDFVVYSQHYFSSGIEAPVRIEILISDDGLAFKPAGTATPNKSNLAREDGQTPAGGFLTVADVEYKCSLETAVDARFVRIRVVGGALKEYCFVSEVEIYTVEPVIQATTGNETPVGNNKNDDVKKSGCAAQASLPSAICFVFIVAFFIFKKTFCNTVKNVER